MGRVCLILPLASSSSLAEDAVTGYRQRLEDAGHEVEILAVAPTDDPRPDDPFDGSWTWLSSRSPGLCSAAMTGLRTAAARDGVDHLIVLDLNGGYHPDDVSGLLAPLAEDQAELVVARRVSEVGGQTIPLQPVSALRRPAAGGVAWLARLLTGASDLLSGLVAMTPATARNVADSFNPVGSRYTIDLLFRSRGRRIERPVRVSGPSAPLALNLNDLRHIKRLADDRFGNASRLLQFCVVGASGMIVDLSTYALFQKILSRTWLSLRTVPVLKSPLDLAVAAVFAVAIAMTWNFSLNRRLTFSDARGGSILRQFLRYALSNALGVGLSLSLRLFLPVHVDFFHHHRLAAAVVGIVAATGVSFSMARWFVFRRPPGDRVGRRVGTSPLVPHALAPAVETS